jgi:hypothetical protein
VTVAKGISGQDGHFELHFLGGSSLTDTEFVQFEKQGYMSRTVSFQAMKRRPCVEPRLVNCWTIDITLEMTP